MARLRAKPPRISGCRPRVGGATGEAARADRKAPWRKLYATARWRRLRLAVLARDVFVCRQTGVLLSGVDPAPNSPVIDHIVPAHVFWWSDGERMFWEMDNLQAVSKQWHDGEKQRLERRAKGATARGG